ncbi:MAG TPA: metallopeptidase family protein [Polyangiaceae bacterium]
MAADPTAADDLEAVLDEALAWVEAEPASADAHYEAALAYEDLELEPERRAEMLEVLRLDTLADRRSLDAYEPLIGSVVERTLAELPRELREKLGPVTILVQPRPDRALVEEGVDARVLGLFDGATAEQLAGTEAPLTPTRVLIFSHNLACTFEDAATLRAEVATTVLHEIGHFFGLDEDDMHRLGLE